MTKPGQPTRLCLGLMIYGGLSLHVQTRQAIGAGLDNSLESLILGCLPLQVD